MQIRTFRFAPLVGAIALTLNPSVGSATVVGFLGNFDVINDTGQEAHGFEIELEGLHSNEVTDVFGGPGRGFPTGRGFNAATSVERYGSPTITEYTNGSLFGTRVTYSGIYAAGTWDFGTPAVPLGTFATPGDNCWSGGGLGYGPSTPCDHFGVGTSKTPTKTTYSWLHETSPGVLSGANGVVSLPAPVFVVSPPAQPNAQPVVVAQVQAPAPEFENQFGEALWVKIFTTELDHEIGLEELVPDNAKVKGASTEVEWQLLQKDPGNPNSGVIENGGNAAVGAGKDAVLRRYEFYKYVGLYDPENHEAKPLVGDSHGVQFDPNNPDAPFDVGSYIGDQNVAVNLRVQPVPLPPALALLGAPLIALCTRRRRAARAS